MYCPRCADGPYRLPARGPSAALAAAERAGAKRPHACGELTGWSASRRTSSRTTCGKLRDGGLVSARRSSADGRDAYYSVDLTGCGELLATPAPPSTPAFALGRAPPVGPRRARRRRGCCSCAPATAPARRWPRRWLATLPEEPSQACSAGSHPKPLHPNAVRVMRDEHGIDLAGRESKHLSVFADQHFDWVISLCDRVREVCPEFPGDPETDPLEHRRPGRRRRPTTTPATRRSSAPPPSSRPASGSCSRRSPTATRSETRRSNDRTE